MSCGSTEPERVAAADAFFLYAESSAAVQQVGGVLMLDASDGPPARAAAIALLRDRLGRLPRFRQRLSAASRWRQPRWVGVTDLDWDWHVMVRRLPPPGGRRALHRLAAELHTTRLPRDRPLWRLVLVPEVEPGVAAAMLVLHHVIADGVGVIRQVLRVTDVLLSAVAGALRRLRPDLAGDRRYARLRTLVPLMVRDQASPAEGNLTGAVMLDLPLAPMPEPERLAAVARSSRRLRSRSRVVASRFVIQLGDADEFGTAIRTVLDKLSE